MSMLPDAKQFVERRNRALIEMDMEYAREMMPAATNDSVRLISMHKARYECVGIAPEFRHASANWLRERNYGGFDMTPLLPEGELPT